MARQPQTKDTKPDPQDEPKTGPFVVIATTHGAPLRRAGLRFGPEGTRIDASTLREDQITRIEAEPLLKVTPEKE